MTGAMVELEHVSKRFVKSLDLAEKIVNTLGGNLKEQVVHAVDKVDLAVNDGEVVGLVGESGCGKSTLGRVIAGIHAASDGVVRFRGRDVAEMSSAEAKDWALQVQMIFQDPMSSLNPRLRVREIIGEAAQYHGLATADTLDDYVDEMMLRVGLDPSFKRRYPHQFSGGQRQRIGIARALAVRPSFLVCDEAIAALDVSIQAQVINLFTRLREDLGLTYLFISHDLAVVHHISTKVGVMYLGRIVEWAASQQLFGRPLHPYTRMLLDAVPDISKTGTKRAQVEGEVPSPINPPSGCAFHPRCPFANERCRIETPASILVEDTTIACHAVQEARLPGAG